MHVKFFRTRFPGGASHGHKAPRTYAIMTIAIVDYGMGNLRSVAKGFERVGVDAAVTSDPNAVRTAPGVVLPGVGAFSRCMSNLTERRLAEPVVESIKAGTPFLGICLGLQLLFTESTEFGSTPGLGVLPGTVVKFPPHMTNGGGGELPVPHMGWNTVHVDTPGSLLGEPGDSYFYFVHSYYVTPDDDEIVLGVTEYGERFVSAIQVDNITAVQFHPEKSQARGLEVLRAFGERVG